MMASNRLLVLLGALILNLAAGSVYVFGAYSGALKSFGLTQQQVQLVSSVGNVGLYVGVFAGMFYDRKGSVPTAMIGCVIAAIGYFLAWLCTTGAFAGIDSTLVLSISFMLAWHGGAWFDCAAVTTAVKLFPANRGLIVGLVKSFFGLSASVLAQSYQTFFATTTVTTNTTGNGTAPSVIVCPNGKPPSLPVVLLSLSRRAAAAPPPPPPPPRPPPVTFLLFLSAFTIASGMIGIYFLTDQYNGSIMNKRELKRLNQGYVFVCIHQ